MPPAGTTLVLAAIALSMTAFSASAGSSRLIQEGIRVPCAFVDSVNLTDSKKLPNGSYVYNNLIIPANMTGEYNYILGSSMEHIPVKAHIRGCVCKLKPCVQFCCPPGEKFNLDNVCQPANETFSMESNVTLSSGDISIENIFEKFAPKIGKVCNSMYPLEPWRYAGDVYHLFENGTVYRVEDGRFLDRSEYCFGAAVLEDNVTEVLTPYNCFQDSVGETKYLVYAWMMLFSVPFILITICVYIGIPELRTLHGKSLCCYLLNLAVGYCVLSAFAIVPQDKISPFSCSFWGFTAYFCFMASFFWLSVISFDLFYNIRAPRGRFNEKKRFILYSIYSWGLAFVFLAMTMYAQLYLPISESWKPAIGSDKYCWLDVRKGWSAFLYFYGPIVIIIFFNITMFVLTALQINSVQKEMSRMVERHDSQRNLRNEKDRFGIFLRLFIVMGVTWLMEIISYCIGEESAWNKFFYITDILNGIQGFLIFTLFVLKKKVKQYITNRYQSTSRRERQSQYSNKTTTSSINLPLNGMSSEKPLMDKSVKIHN